MATASKGKGYDALRRALLDRTKWSQQVLSQRVQKVKRRLPMKTGVAQAIVAHGEGLKPERFLGSDDLREVQQTIAKLGAPASPNGPRPARAKGPATRALSFRAYGIKTRDPFLDKGKLDEAVEMSKAYPVLYVLENSIRNVIRRVMEARFGADWWNTQLTSGKASDLKTKVNVRLTKEDAQSWHPRRGAHPIDYIDLGDLLIIAQSKRDVFFPSVLGDEKWFEGLINETSPSRNVLCHMNPLADHSVTALGVKLTQWLTHLEAREAVIRAAMTPAK